MNTPPSLLKKELKIKSDKNNDYNVEIFIDSNSLLKHSFISYLFNKNYE